jgi:hypothetical protein
MTAGFHVVNMAGLKEGPDQPGLEDDAQPEPDLANTHLKT